MKLFNTLSKKLENFEPLEKGKVKMYQCGPTVYWVQHIGNMRAMVAGDIVRRTLQYLGNDVTYVRNYTDFGHLVSDADAGEDKMEKGAKREGISAKEIAEKYIKIFDQDVEKINTFAPTYSTRATEYIGEMINIVKDLLEKGYAYSTPEAIYYDISKFDNYTKLSGQKLEMLMQGAGHGDETGSHKRNPADFALWFFRTGSHANTSLYWESPFESSEVENGIGTPGWHVECSAMAIAKLGESMDIHMGGIEHIPVHHTNEIAQSEAYTGKPFARYWLHNEHLTVNGGKMSKSGGTAFSLDDIVARGYDPMHLRYLFLQAHYRSKQDFTWESLDGAKSAYERLVSKLSLLKKGSGKVSDVKKEQFINALEEDFGIPQAVAIIWETLADNSIAESDRYVTILDFDKVLGLRLEEAVGRNLESQDEELPDNIKSLLEERKVARDKKDFELSDNLRDKIAELGYLVKDGEEGQSISRK